MNRYRTTPGLGPQKATTTTTCQKCLSKGHYSYECKSALQSRPYVSRASRTQQLRNPKLKPVLTETKLAEPVEKHGSVLSDGPYKIETIPAQSIAPGEKHLSHVKQHRRPRSTTPDQPSKRRRRSTSMSSDSSVATISTEASYAGDDAGKERRQQREARRSRSRSLVRQRTSPSLDRSRSPPRFDELDSDPARGYETSRRRKDASQYSGDGQRPKSATRGQRVSPPSNHLRKSEDFSERSKPSNTRRPRSLSPYSRRLALTQAMNADR